MNKSKKTILLVEDDPILGLRKKAMLQECGYEVFVEGNGESGLEKFMKDGSIDLVLLDIDLGSGMDGPETAQKMLLEREVPIMFLSNHTELEIVEKTEQITSYGYVVKNSGITVLNASIKMAFKLFEANKKIQETQFLLEASMDGSKDMIMIMVDREYRYLYSNSTNRAGMKEGYGVDIQMGVSILDYIPASDAANSKANFDRAFSGESHVEIEQYGTIKRSYFETHYSPIRNSKNEIIGASAFSTNITQRKAIEDSLKNSQRELQLAQNISQVGSWNLNVASGEMTWSQTMYTIFGVDAQVLGDTNLYVHFCQVVHPDDKAEFRNNEEEIKSGHRSTPFDYRIVLPNGEIRYVSTDAIALNGPDGKAFQLSGTTQDVTERKVADIELENAKNILDSIIENIPNMVFLKDAKSLRFLLFNKFGESLLGLSRKDMIGKSDWDFFPQGQADFFVKKDREVVKTQKLLDIPEETISTKTGTRVLHTQKVPIVNSKGVTEYLLGISEDITDRKKAEDKVISLLAEKELMLKEVHHRIKNNMSAIKGLLWLQADAMTDSKAAAALLDAESRVQSMMVLYDKLYHSTDYKRLSVKAYLPTLIEATIENFANSESVKVEQDIDDFSLDIERLQPLGIIVNELLTNIMKYAFQSTENRKIFVSAKLIDQTVSLAVSDNGAGLPPSVGFENSSGFGLMLIGMLAKQIKGKLTTESGAGTRIRLEFPL